MKFHKWLQLQESGRFSFAEPADVGGGRATYLDMRVEDWEIKPRELRHPEAPEWHDAVHLKKILSASQFATIPSFYGSTPDGTYIYHRKGDIGKVMLLPSKPSNGIDLDKLPLVNNWWDYAELVSDDNRRVKTAGRQRIHTWAGQPTNIDIDQPAVA